MSIIDRFKKTKTPDPDHKDTILAEPDSPGWIDRRTGKFRFYKAKDGWRWQLLSSNGKLIAESGEAYIRRYDCKQAVLRLPAVASSARVEDDQS